MTDLDELLAESDRLLEEIDSELYRTCPKSSVCSWRSSRQSLPNQKPSLKTAPVKQVKALAASAKGYTQPSMTWSRPSARPHVY